jgi:L-threonylcarbamoyladenylate synthase
MVCNPVAPDEAAVTAIVDTLEAGLAVVLPTETQYGLAMRADSASTSAAISRIKGRSETERSALFVKDISMAESLCRFTALARSLAMRFLPGPLTLVLPVREAQSIVPVDFISAYGLGIRLSSSPLVAAVMARVPFPVTATSANRSGEIPLATVASIRSSLGEEVSLYIDGGPCPDLAPSTVAAVNGQVKILRQGAIAEADIRSYLRQEGLDG